MFSTAQQAYIEALLPTYAKDGYKYYVVYSNTVANSGFYGSTDPDLYVVFSKKAISAKNAYSYGIGDSSILVTVRSGNYSSSSSANNDDRITISCYKIRKRIKSSNSKPSVSAVNILWCKNNLVNIFSSMIYNATAIRFNTDPIS